MQSNVQGLNVPPITADHLLAGVQNARSVGRPWAAAWTLVSTLTTSTVQHRQAAPSTLGNTS